LRVSTYPNNLVKYIEEIKDNYRKLEPVTEISKVKNTLKKMYLSKRIANFTGLSFVKGLNEKYFDRFVKLS